MKFTPILALALPAIALAQGVTKAAPVPTGAPDLTVCQENAGPYADACSRCYHNCETSSAPDQCFYSVFSAINGIQAQCEARGGQNCRGKAIDQVCGQ